MVLGVGAGLQGGEFSGGAFWSNRRHPGLQLVSWVQENSEKRDTVGAGEAHGDGRHEAG